MNVGRLVGIPTSWHCHVCYICFEVLKDLIRLAHLSKFSQKSINNLSHEKLVPMSLGSKEGDGPSHLNQSSMTACSKCNQKTRVRSRFCNYCGSKLDDQRLITYDVFYKSLSDGIRLTIPEDWVQITHQELANTPTASDVRWAFRPPAYEGEESAFFVKSSSSPEIEAAFQKNSVSSLMQVLVKSILDAPDPSCPVIQHSIDSVNGIDIARFVLQYRSDQSKELQVYMIRNGMVHILIFRAIKSYEFYYPAIEKIISSLEYID
jgi:hypothetical protein